MSSPEPYRTGGESAAVESNMKAAGIREIKDHKLPLQFNERNFVKVVEFKNKLSGAGKEELAALLKTERNKY